MEYGRTKICKSFEKTSVGKIGSNTGKVIAHKYVQRPQLPHRNCIDVDDNGFCVPP